METITLNVEGMTCQGCVRSVKKVLEAVAGVESAEVSLEPARAQVRYDPGRASVEQLKQAVQDAGYHVAAA